MAVNFLLCYIVTKDCVLGAVLVWLWICMCVWIVCVPFCENLYVCMRVEFVCSCLCVWVCIQLCVFVSCFCVPNMLDLSMPLPVPIFMHPMSVCIYASLSCMCIAVSILSECSCLPVWKDVQRSYNTVCVTPFCSSQTRDWLSVSSMLLRAEWLKKEPWNFRWTWRVPC